MAGYNFFELYTVISRIHIRFFKGSGAWNCTASRALRIVKTNWNINSMWPTYVRIAQEHVYAQCTYFIDGRLMHAQWDFLLSFFVFYIVDSYSRVTGIVNIMICWICHGSKSSRSPSRRLLIGDTSRCQQLSAQFSKQSMRGHWNLQDMPHQIFLITLTHITVWQDERRTANTIGTINCELAPAISTACPYLQI